MLLSDLPPRYQAQVSQQLNGAKPAGMAKAAALRDAVVSAPEKPTLRQRSGQKLNKTEAAWLEILRAQHPLDRIHEQALTLAIGNGVRYTPDFVVSSPAGLATEGVYVTAYEVKGFMRDDAAVKLKVAASLYTWISFVLVQYDRKARTWHVEEVRA